MLLPTMRKVNAMGVSERLAALGGYAFDELDRLAAARSREGADVIDFGVGDPTEPVPELVIEAAQRGLTRFRQAGYPSYVGSLEFRQAAAAWIEQRHQVTVDPETMVTATSGSKEAVFHTPLAFVNPGQVVLAPSPGYPPYAVGTHMAGGRCVHYPVFDSLIDNSPMLPDLDKLPEADAESLAMVWITQPHVPTGRIAGKDSLARLAGQCRERGVLLCSDEAYSELWFDEPPQSALCTGLDGVLSFFSLSKQSTMTSYRIGFVAGDPEAIGSFRKLKTQIDSGTPQFVQEAAIAALGDHTAAAQSRASYAARADVLIPALRGVGCSVERPEAGFYLWVTVPEGATGLGFARELLNGTPALAVLPGEWLTETVAGLERQPGEGRVRLALVPSLKRCQEAAERLSQW
ncbi:MAG: LL-diaminopimelate aminotransferase [Pseudohongiellaceae bacterium]|jgi:LL-diaminopimelate aminotransferase